MKSLVAVLLLFCPLALIADQGHHHQFDPNEKLGTVHFPISCAKATQVSFERGVALLHTFWYDQAQQQFKEIETKDPGCAIAYWGEAMSIFHQIWDRPNENTLKRGQEMVQHGQRIGAKTQRERDYLDALAIFYRPSGYSDYQVRIDAYSQAMGKLYEKYPDDHEAGAFYALSLLASALPGDTTFANDKKAIAILDKLFEQEPDHPGIPHYIIHSCDSPQLAPLGLNAARRYAKIAPSAPHAVHMPSHIFARLGLWQEDIQSNLGSIAAAEKSGAMGHALHAMDFLNYAYLQVGEDGKAREIVAKVATAQGAMAGHDMSDYLDKARAEFPATYMLETRQWKDAAALPPVKGAAPQNAAITYWARGVANGHLHDAAAAKKDLEAYETRLEAVKKSSDAYLAEFMDTARDEVRAWTAFAEGKNDEAVQIMRTAADKQDSLGKAEVEIPAREMLADILLESNHPEQALIEYEQSMKVDPNRFNGLYGAARAAELAKQPGKAEKYYTQLVKNCQGSMSQRPELARAKEHLAAKSAVGGN